MVALLDLIGAAVIRGGIIMILLQLTLSMQDVLYERTERAAMDQAMYEGTTLLSYEFRQMGYHASGTTITELDTNRITFQSDITNDGTADQIRYSVAQMSGIPDSLGVKKYFLNRSLNGGTALPMLRYVTRFRIQCFDVNGNMTSTASQVKSLLIIIQTQSNNYFNGRYPASAWQSQIFPMNL